MKGLTGVPSAEMLLVPQTKGPSQTWGRGERNVDHTADSDNLCLVSSVSKTRGFQGANCGRVITKFAMQ